MNALGAASKKILSETGIAPGKIGGITFSSQMQGLALVGKDGRALRPAMSYMDQRAVRIKKQFSRGIAVDDVPVGLLLRSIGQTGIAPTSVKDPLWKYLWVKENEKGPFRGSGLLGWTLKDYLIYRLTGGSGMHRGFGLRRGAL